jgi:signal transduction histidine kinase
MDRPQRRLSRRSAWERTFWLWDVYFAVVYGSVLVSLLADRDTTTARRLLAIAALSTMAVLYAVVGRPLIRTGDRGWRSTAFMTAVVGLFAGAVVCASSVAFMLFAICPLAFLAAPVGPAVALVVAANLMSPTVALLRDGLTAGLLTHLAPISAVSMAFAVWLGIWIGQVVRQSEERADLIGQLEHSRAEVARLSHRAGIAAERARLAGEIHDTLAQGFTSIITLLQAAGPDQDRSRAEERIALAVRTARENLAESRAMVAALAPSQLDTGSLEQSISRQVRRLAEETSIVASYRTTGSVRVLPMPTEVVLLRAVQEALSNVRKHAKAQQVAVALDYAEHRVRLTVHDDGQGFDTASPSDGYGLRGMRAGAEQVSGILTVHSGLRVGTTIELEVPQ